ncbi:Hepatocellular carcinoma-associated antigen 59 [Penicillium brevicompactum]|uniref:Hepatocellular carcinoma-associated antigen 59 n=1 Tax=Penicillium brevicompactum TaxID=5074 RepID=A0A9W9ULW2_PENBR|nr:Hepatocellular carcinoma-associated antigen 59 [Penicillium brevicompactum]
MLQNTMTPEVEHDLSETLFRPAKKRKFARRRADHDAEDADADADPALVANNQKDNTPSAPPSSNQIRRPRTARKGGIGFSAKSQLGGDHGQQLALRSTGDLEEDKIRAMHERFTGYTGQSDDVDRHMYGPPPGIGSQLRVAWTNKIRMAYIDSEMAKRYQPHAPAQTPDSNQSQSKDVAVGQPFQPQQQREPASLGRLHEIDLGQEATLRNIARTEAATRRLAGDEEVPVGDITPEAGRSGSGGKSRRNHKQRTDADIERDRLVEEVLRESKLDVYDDYEDDAQIDDPQAADDRVAEQFRRDFMDAMQSRRRLRTTKPAVKDEGPKGPKLGGSRSARAAMREAQPGKK